MRGVLMMFGQRLLNLLLERDISQKQLAIELKLPPTTLNGYINNRREPDYQTLLEIANYFHVSTDYLLGNQNTIFIEPHPYDFTKQDILMLHYYKKLNPNQKEIIDELLKLMQHQNAPE